MDRTVWTLILALGGMLFFASQQTPTESLPAELFWDYKLVAAPAEIVLGGDSRTAVGLSPSRMEGVLRRSVFNNAWNAAGFSPAYTADIEAHLVGPGRERAVVLGITPWSLTPKASAASQFTAQVRRPRLEVRLAVWTSGVSNRFSPFEALRNPDASGSRSIGAGGGIKRIVYSVDGWAATRLDPPKPDATLPVYVKNFADGNVVSNAIAAQLCRTIEGWVRSGVRVYGYRPPTTPAMVELEDRLSGYREDEIAHSLMSAGAVWLRVSRTYQTSDGSHLQDDAALAFSDELARMIAATWTPRAPRPDP